MKICHSCGAEVSDTAKFCRKCGAKLEMPAPAQEAAAPAGEFRGEQPLGEEPAAEFQGTDYPWGPPTGGDNYDEPAMPAVFIGDAEAEEPPQEEPPQAPYSYRIEAPSYDHTEEFDPKDISENKVTAMAAYLLGPLGVIIALLAGQDSPYAKFHMRQGLKFLVVEALISIIAALLCWTLIVPAAAAICLIILGVVEIITIISVCRGRAVEPAIIRSLGFLK